MSSEPVHVDSDAAQHRAWRRLAWLQVAAVAAVVLVVVLWVVIGLVAPDFQQRALR